VNPGALKIILGVDAVAVAVELQELGLGQRGELFCGRQ
jgi:hypothetical protein